MLRVRQAEYHPDAYQAILTLPARVRGIVLDKIDEMVADSLSVQPLGTTEDGIFWTLSGSGHALIFDVEEDRVLILDVLPVAAFFAKN